MFYGKRDNYVLYANEFLQGIIFKSPKIDITILK